MADFDNVYFEVKDIFLMDKGTGAFTSYDFDGDVADYIMDKTMEDHEFATFKLGHIHSHNTMAVFFSGTDTDELHDNVSNHNFYLSLIVNNFMDMTAKLAYEVKASCYQAIDEKGEVYNIPLTDSTNRTMFIQECDIEVPTQEIVVEPAFEERTKHVIKKCDEKPKSLPKPASHYYASGSAPLGKPNHQNVLPIYVPNKGSEKDIDMTRPLFDHEDDKNRGGELDELLMDNFAAFVIQFGDNKIKDEDVKLITALEEMARFNQEAEAIAAHIITNYHTYYQDFFDDIDEVSMEEFTDTVDELAGAYGEYAERFPFLKVVIAYLRSYCSNLENKWREGLLVETK